ncbi:MAG: OmpA family protein [Chitinophagaceae bacterium]|nr:OmpA family protein [Chitinophagaceae bacterium]
MMYRALVIIILTAFIGGMKAQRKEPVAEQAWVVESNKASFGSGVLFADNRADLNSTADDHLAKLTDVLNKYPDTYVRVEGHTDCTGATDYNLGVSERAKEVSSFLVKKRVGPG